MTFKELLAQVIEWIQQVRRVSYRSLKRQFNLDDVCFEDLQEGLLYTYAEVIEDDGHGFVWTGDPPTLSQSAPSETDSEITSLPDS